MARLLKVGDRVQINEQRQGYEQSYNGRFGIVKEPCPDFPDTNLHVAIEFTLINFCAVDETFRFIEGALTKDGKDELRNEEAKWQRYFE